MKQYFYSLVALCAVASAPCLASDARTDTLAIARAALNAKCSADADAAGVHGKDRHKTIRECRRKNAVPNPHKALTKKCLSEAEGKKGEEWKQSVLACIEPIMAAEEARME